MGGMQLVPGRMDDMGQPASRPGRSRALTSTTVVRLEALSETTPAARPEGLRAARQVADRRVGRSAVAAERLVDRLAIRLRSAASS